MIIEKGVLTNAINRVKDIVPKKSSVESMQSILVKHGYLIANSTEIEAKVKIDGAEEDFFLIPHTAFALINNLPKGQVEIVGTAEKICINAPGVKTSFITMNPVDFPLVDEEDCKESNTKVDSLIFENLLKHVQSAIGDNSSNPALTSLCIRAKDNVLSFIGMDGKQISWSHCESSQDDFQLLIPKNAVSNILKMGFSGDVRISYGKNAVAFKSAGCEVYSRQVYGKYFDYEKMFQDNNWTVVAQINRQLLIESLNRVKSCKDGEFPVRLEFNDENINISLKTFNSDYYEQFYLEEKIDQQLEIGFDSKLLIDSLKSFTDDILTAKLRDNKSPVLLMNDKNDRSLILPVMMK